MKEPRRCGLAPPQSALPPPSSCMLSMESKVGNLRMLLKERECCCESAWEGKRGACECKKGMCQKASRQGQAVAPAADPRATTVVLYAQQQMTRMHSAHWAYSAAAGV